MGFNSEQQPPDQGSPRVLITGGAGFIGGHLVRHVVDQGYVVRVLELPATPADHLPQRRVEVVPGDIRSGEHVCRAMDGCGTVLHLAANPNLWARRGREFEEVNHQGTRRVLAAAATAGVQRFVHVSTESILATRHLDGTIDESVRPQLPEMIGPYCRSKLRAEQAAFAAAEAGLPVVVVNPTVPVGPGDRRLGPMSRLICQLAKGRVWAYLDGQINLIDVRDAAAGIWAAALRGRVGQRYVLAGENWMIHDLFATVAELTGRPAPTIAVPYAAALAFAHLEEGYCRYLRPRRTPVATVTGVRLTRRCFRFDGSASAAELGLTLRPVRESLRQALAFFQSSGAIPGGDRSVAARSALPVTEES